MSDQVQIRHYARKYGDSTIHTYEAYCVRCHENVGSNAGRVGVPHNRSWVTKAPAVKAAREHLEMHRERDEYLASGGMPHGWDIKEIVTL